MGRSTAVDQRRTRAHYEAKPFITGGDPRVDLWTKRLSSLLSEEDVAGTSLDIGCGTGEVSVALRRLGSTVLALDLTTAATVATVRAGISGVQATALALPVRPRAVDLTIAIGSLHHTPDCSAAFRQMADVTRQTMVVLLYSRWTPYHLAYLATAHLRRGTTALDPRRMPYLLRQLMRVLIQPQVRTRLDDEQLARVVADQFLTPVATFHHLRQVRRWARAAGFEVRSVVRSRGYSFTVVLDRSEQLSLQRATARHYEEFPFIEGGRHRRAHWRRRLSIHLPRSIAQARVLEAGCGSGDLATALEEDGAALVAIDLTVAATRRTASRLQHGTAVRASLLHLPFRDQAFDIATSVGVVHHTPSPRECIQELARVTDGLIVVMVYARWTPYQLAYRLARPLRHLDATTLHRVPDWALRPLIALNRLSGRQELGPAQVRTLLADQLWTPVASFHSAREVRAWATELDLRVVRHQRLLWHAHLVSFRHE